MMNSWVPLPENNMSFPLPPKAITLNAAELKEKNNNKYAFEQHQTSLLHYSGQKICFKKM